MSCFFFHHENLVSVERKFLTSNLGRGIAKFRRTAHGYQRVFTRHRRLGSRPVHAEQKDSVLVILCMDNTGLLRDQSGLQSDNTLENWTCRESGRRNIFIDAGRCCPNPLQRWVLLVTPAIKFSSGYIFT